MPTLASRYSAGEAGAGGSGAAHRPRAGPGLAAARVEDGQAVVELHDNGPGIEPEDLPKVFDPFFTTKPVGKGTGLGLTISYGIVERHGGLLTAGNHPGGGALFTLRLPLAR